MQPVGPEGLEILDAVSGGDFDRWGDLMHQHWCEKRKLSAGITVPGLDELYDEARSRFGVRGGKTREARIDAAVERAARLHLGDVRVTQRDAGGAGHGDHLLGAHAEVDGVALLGQRGHRGDCEHQRG